MSVISKPKSKKSKSNKKPAAVKRKDAEPSKKYKEGKPWYADTLPARLTRIADENGITVQALLRQPACMEVRGISLGDLTDGDIAKAKYLESAWSQSFQRSPQIRSDAPAREEAPRKAQRPQQASTEPVGAPGKDLWGWKEGSPGAQMNSAIQKGALSKRKLMVITDLSITRIALHLRALEKRGYIKFTTSAKFELI